MKIYKNEKLLSLIICLLFKCVTDIVVVVILKVISLLRLMLSFHFQLVHCARDACPPVQFVCNFIKFARKMFQTIGWCSHLGGCPPQPSGKSWIHHCDVYSDYCLLIDRV